ncbi:unnamed protein product [Sphagnum balticum]
MPRISLKLNKLEGTAAHDIMGAISNNLFKADRMQEQLDTATFSGKRKQHAVLPLPDLPPTQIPSGEKFPLRNTPLPHTQPGIPEAGKAEKVVSKPKNWVLEFMLLLQQEEGGEWELSSPEDKMMMTRNDCQVPETYLIKDIDIYDNLQFCVVIISSIARLALTYLGSHMPILHQNHHRLEQHLADT